MLHFHLLRRAIDDPWSEYADLFVMSGDATWLPRIWAAAGAFHFHPSFIQAVYSRSVCIDLWFFVCLFVFFFCLMLFFFTYT